MSISLFSKNNERLDTLQSRISWDKKYNIQFKPRIQGLAAMPPVNLANTSSSTRRVMEK